MLLAGLEQFILKGNNLLGLYNRQLTSMSTWVSSKKWKEIITLTFNR